MQGSGYRIEPTPLSTRPSLLAPGEYRPARGRANRVRARKGSRAAFSILLIEKSDPNPIRATMENNPTNRSLSIAVAPALVTHARRRLWERRGAGRGVSRGRKTPSRVHPSPAYHPLPLTKNQKTKQVEAPVVSAPLACPRRRAPRSPSWSFRTTPCPPPPRQGDTNKSKHKQRSHPLVLSLFTIHTLSKSSTSEALSKCTRKHSGDGLPDSLLALHNTHERTNTKQCERAISGCGGLISVLTRAHKLWQRVGPARRAAWAARA
jgi:hypothetical protein